VSRLQQVATAARAIPASRNKGRQTEFLPAIGDHRIYAATTSSHYAACAAEQAAGLRWCDVDLDEGVAAITQQLQQYDGYLTACPPKTARSARVIALDRTTMTALRDHKARQRQESTQAASVTARAGTSSPASTATRWLLTG
jgi:integrase